VAGVAGNQVVGRGRDGAFEDAVIWRVRKDLKGEVWGNEVGESFEAADRRSGSRRMAINFSRSSTSSYSTRREGERKRLTFFWKASSRRNEGRPERRRPETITFVS
jgi:hypothetical protein